MYAWHAAQLFRTLAHERSLRVLSLLAGAGAAAMSVQQIALRAGLSERSARRTLQRLAEAGLAKASRRRGCEHYRVEPDRVAELLGFVARRLSPRDGATPAAARAKPLPYRSLTAKLGAKGGGRAVARLADPVPEETPRYERSRLADRLSTAA